MSKRIGAILLALVLAMSLCPLPAAAAGTYTVTLPAGATGPDTVAEGEDYTFTLSENDLIVAYAEYADGSICAAKVSPTFEEGDAIIKNGETRTIPADCITGSFEIKTFHIITDLAEPFYDLLGDGSAENPYQIGTELQLLQFMASCTANYDMTGALSTTVFTGADMHYILTSDIVFHTPIAMQIAPNTMDANCCNYLHYTYAAFAYSNFAGTFDGNGKTISGLRYGDYAGQNLGIGLIPNNSGTVKNLTLAVESAVIQPVYYHAGTLTLENYAYRPARFSPLVVVNTGTIQNCAVTAEVVSQMTTNPDSPTFASDTWIGLIAAENYNAVIADCRADGTISVPETSAGTAKYNYVGIICGRNFGGTINECTSDGAINVTCPRGNNCAGGIAGQSLKSAGQNVFGQTGGTSQEAVINRCVNHADITGTTGNAQGMAQIGGIAGGNKQAHVMYCMNDGNISTLQTGGKQEYVGGIVGRAFAKGGSITGCYNLGSVSSHGIAYDLAGGVIGEDAHVQISVKGCFSYVNGLWAVNYDPEDTVTVSYTYTLADATDSDADETSEEVELSAADFKAASLVTTLNTALGEDIFAAGTDYPVFSWLAAPVCEGPEIVTQPLDQGVKPGKIAAFTVEAEGEEPLSYQWYYRSSAEGAWKSVANNGTSAAYTLTAKSKYDGYQFYCTVTDDEGNTVDSEPATLTVARRVVITAQPVSVYCSVGDTAVFSLETEGKEVTYQWYYRTSPSGAWTRIKGNKGKRAAYRLKTEERHDGYQFCCVVTNADGKRISTRIATLNVG